MCTSKLKRVSRLIKCRLANNGVLCEFVMIKETEDRTSKLIPKQRSIKQSKPFRGIDAAIGSHIIMLYFTQELLII